MATLFLNNSLKIMSHAQTTVYPLLVSILNAFCYLSVRNAKLTAK